MSLQVEKLEKNMAKLTIEVSAEDLDKAMEKAYQKQKSRISLPGFRKGKAPRKMIESMYGKGVFMEDAVNSLVPQEYTKALGECDLEIVSQPEINVTQMEPGKALIFTADVAVKPEVTLGDYKGVEVPKSEIAVTDEEVDAEVKKEQDKNARTVAVEDRAAANGDITTIDFEGFVDGVAFDGGKGTDYALTLGSGTFIPGFEDQLVGANTGDHVEVKVTFPEEYQAKELAGKEAVFQCDVKKIETKEVPELDDEFAKDVSEFDTLAEYKEDVKKKLTEKKEKEARTAKENAAVDKAIVFSLGGKVYTGNTQIYYIFISVHSVIQLQFFPICGLQHHRSDHKPMLPLRTCNCHGLYLSLLPQEAVRCLQPEFHLMFSLSWQCDLPRSGSQ